jgi:hypothetical protein
MHTSNKNPSSRVSRKKQMANFSKMAEKFKMAAEPKNARILCIFGVKSQWRTGHCGNAAIAARLLIYVRMRGFFRKFEDLLK